MKRSLKQKERVVQGARPRARPQIGPLSQMAPASEDQSSVVRARRAARGPCNAVLIPLSRDDPVRRHPRA